MIKKENQTENEDKQESYERLQIEHEDLKIKFEKLRRNFDSISNSAFGDKAEFGKIKAMKEQYE